MDLETQLLPVLLTMIIYLKMEQRMHVGQKVEWLNSL